MWSFIESSDAALPKKDKERVEKEADPFGKNPKFPGFDGNNEAEWLSVATFLVEKMDRFTVRCVNSHMRTLDGYRRMLCVWERMRPALTGGTMSAAQIVELLNARRFPKERDSV